MKTHCRGNRSILKFSERGNTNKLQNHQHLAMNRINTLKLIIVLSILTTLIIISGCNSESLKSKQNLKRISFKKNNFINVKGDEAKDTLLKIFLSSWRGQYDTSQKKFIPEIEYQGFLSTFSKGVLLYKSDVNSIPIKFIDFTMRVHDTLNVETFFWMKKFKSDSIKVYKKYKLVREENSNIPLPYKNLYHFKFLNFSFKRHNDDLDIYLTKDLDILAVALVDSIVVNNPKCVYMFTGDTCIIKLSNILCNVAEM